MTPAQIMCFYDETLKKQIDGFYKYDGKTIHVSSSVYGARSAPPLFSALRCFPDHNAVELFAKQVLSELARDAEKPSATSHSLKKAA
ncbi:MAG TPA: hypothetical protein VH678_01895 [Xanthobacteraceae bacterium]|jgi:hypothetical protein